MNHSKKIHKTFHISWDRGEGGRGREEGGQHRGGDQLHHQHWGQYCVQWSQSSHVSIHPPGVLTRGLHQGCHHQCWRRVREARWVLSNSNGPFKLWYITRIKSFWKENIYIYRLVNWIEKKRCIYWLWKWRTMLWMNNDWNIVYFVFILFVLLIEIL